MLRDSKSCLSPEGNDFFVLAGNCPGSVQATCSNLPSMGDVSSISSISKSVFNVIQSHMCTIQWPVCRESSNPMECSDPCMCISKVGPVFIYNVRELLLISLLSAISPLCFSSLGLPARKLNLYFFYSVGYFL